MTEIDANLTVSRTGRASAIAWVAVVASLMTLNLAMKCLVPHVSPRQEWLVAAMFGAWAGESMVFGAWTALGFGAFANRLLVTIPCLLALYVVPVLVRVNYADVERIEFVVIAMTAFVIYAASIALFLAARWLTALRIEPPDNARVADQAPFRFGTKHMFGAITVYALLFGIMSQLDLTAAPPGLATYTFGPSVYFSVNSVSSAVVSVVLLPTLAFPILLLRDRVTRRALWIAVSLWLVVTVLAMAGFVHAEGAPPLEVLLYIILLQLGATVVGVLAALPMRCAGCRLIGGRRAPEALRTSQPALRHD